MGGVVEDLRKLGIKNWWRVARDRDHGRKFCGKPRLASGYSAADGDEDITGLCVHCTCVYLHFYAIDIKMFQI
jgi:hypothetical protein